MSRQRAGEEQKDPVSHTASKNPDILESLPGAWEAVMTVLSHQLKNPVAHYTSGIRMLKDRRMDLATVKGQEAIGALEKYGVEAVTWIDALLWFSRIQEEHAEKHAIDTNSLVRQVRDRLVVEGVLQEGDLEIAGRLPAIHGFEGWPEALFKRWRSLHKEDTPTLRQLSVQESTDPERHRFVMTLKSANMEWASEATLESVSEIQEFASPAQVSWLLVRKLAEKMGGDAGRTKTPGDSERVCVSSWVELPRAVGSKVRKGE